MDLRSFGANSARTEAAATLLRYQPFVVDENRVSGAAYSGMYTGEPTSFSAPDFFFDRRAVSEDIWKKAFEANRRLAAMYDGFIKRIVEICPPDGAYLDFGCNNGYLPVGVSLRGIRTAVGVDLGDYSDQVRLLNEITGAAAKFSTGSYDPACHKIRVEKDFGIHKYDVVSTIPV